MSDPAPKPEPAAPSLWQTALSVLAAFFGVQSSRNRQRDFTSGKASHFIILGLVLTIVFVLTVVVIVKIVLNNAGL